MMNAKKRSVFGLALLTAVVMASCGDRKSENTSNAADADSMAAVEKGNKPVLGMEGDTMNSSTTGPTQAPPDSGDRGAIVPANVDVRKDN